MLTNLIKKIADRNFLLFSQCFFNFTAEGERNCKIKIVTYDFNGDIQYELDIREIFNDFLFFSTLGSYMVVWLGQMVDEIIRRRDADSLSKLFFEGKGRIPDILFGAHTGYILSDALSLFNQETKTIVIENHAIVQFKIHKITKNQLVRVVNIPVARDIECQMYLFVLLFDFFCKKYANAYKMLRDGCLALRKRNHEFYDDSKLFQVIAYEVTEAMAEKLLEQSD